MGCCYRRLVRPETTRGSWCVTSNQGAPLDHLEWRRDTSMVNYIETRLCIFRAYCSYYETVGHTSTLPIIINNSLRTQVNLDITRYQTFNYKRPVPRARRFDKIKGNCLCLVKWLEWPVKFGNEFWFSNLSKAYRSTYKIVFLTLAPNCEPSSLFEYWYLCEYK